MNDTTTEKDKPSLCRLLLHLDSREFTAAIVSTVEDSSLRVLRIPLPDGPTESALEEAVYSHPRLLADYRKVDLVVRTPQFSLLPGEMETKDVDSLASEFVYEGTEGVRFVDELTIGGSERLKNVWAVKEREVMNFLMRTFSAPSIHHHLTPLLKYFGRRNVLGNSGKLYVNVHSAADGGERGELDLLSFGLGGRLELANTIPFDGLEDAQYYILAAARASGLNVGSDEILIGGDRRLRASLLSGLRQFASYVMPQVFPAEGLRIGNEAPEIPFSLILMPICE
ncbi:MAG: DUF3822 family protein [Muribaculaceae bacterium]|nr:DUF3822 family protein [Muribaculaceae bacterium]